MKRTQDRYNKTNDGIQNLYGFSGCREFNGEDLTFESRSNYLKQQQRKWLDEQIKEK